MKGKGKMSLIAAVMIMLAVLAVFAGCVVDEQPPEPQGYTVTLWEGNSYALAQDDVDSLFESVPSREGYLFGGWFFDNGTWQKPVTAAGLAASEEGTIIYAKWTATGDLALVTFYDHRDGVVLYRAYAEKGSDLSSFDISPTFRPADERYEYVFKGWDKDLTAIAGDTDVRPVYDEIARTYNVTFIVNNVAAKVVSVPYGGAVEAPDAEDISTYLPHINGKKVTFSGWSATAEELSSITEDTEVVALWSTEDIYFEVTFNYGYGQTTTQTVRYGEDAVPPTYGLDKTDDLGVDHVFVGWDNNYCFVTEDRVINAVYDDHTAWYRVDFYVDNVVYCRYYVEGGEASPMPADPVKLSDETNNYTFDKWLDSSGREADLGSITSDTKVYAHFGTQKRTYTVEFYVEGKLVDTQSVTTGAAAVAPGEDKIKAAISSEEGSEEGVEKKFKGWDKTYGEVKSDLVVNAVIERRLETRTVTFKWGLEGEKSEVMTVTFGTAAVAPEVENTTIEKEDGIIYVFDGWEVVTTGYDSWTSVKSDLTVEAQYKTYPKVFAVRFLDAEGALIGDVQMVEYGGKATAPSENPQKAADAQYTYEFDHWDKDFTSVTSDLTISPLYNAITRSYTVTFYDADGAQIGEAQTVAYGEGASVPDPAPVKAATPQYEYIFAGWTGGDVGKIIGDTKFYPIYKESLREYTVTFVYGKVDEPGSSDYHEVIQQVEYGGKATAPEEEAKKYTGTDTTEYQFAGWETSNYLNVTEDLTVKAVYRTYDKYFNVTFRDESGALLSAPQYVRYGQDEVVLPNVANIVKQQDVQYTYAFDGWTYDDGKFISDEDFAAIAGGMTVERDYELTAHFAATLRKYTVIFYDDDRTTVLSEQQVDYGTSAIQPEAPTKEQTVQWVYTFGGWDSDKWTNITGDTVVYATYLQSLRKYDVTFVYGNVDDQSSDDYRTKTIQVEYGKIPTVPEDIDPTRPSTAKYDYAFNGWNGLLAVSGDMTVTADYVATIRNYKVTFYNMTTGASEGTDTMPYGSWIERTMSAGGYVFDSWYTKEGDNYVALPTKDDAGEGHVTGDMTLYGNLVMEGITFDSNNNISGYTGSNSFVVIPAYANRQKVEEINSYMFRGRTQEEIEAVYLPLGVQVSANAFRSMDDEPLEADPATWDRIYDEDVVKTLIVYCQAEDDGGFDYNWDSNALRGGISSDNKYFNVINIKTIGDYNYVLINDDGENKAIIQRFVNGTKKYVELPTGTVTDGTGESAVEYRITELAGSAFRGMSNVETVFIAAEWEDLKVGRYVFSGLTATIYLAIDEPALGSTIPGIGSADIADWNVGWANTASGDEGELTLEWNCDGLYTQDEVTYLLRSNGEAIAISQEFTFVGDFTKLTIPETLTVGEKSYTVTEIGDQLFKDERLLTDVSIPGTIKRIGEQAFFGTNLKSLTLAEGLEEIGNLAFAMNSNLAYVYIPASCDTIGYFAFAGANNAELFMGRKSAPTGSGLIGYKVGWNTTVDLTGLDLSSIGSIVTSLVGSGTTLPTYWNAVGKTEVTLEGKNGIALIARAVLEFVVQKDGNARLIRVSQAGVYAKLNNFVIPATVEYNGVSYTVTSIDGGAFGDWEMETLGIPSTVTSIASNAFSSIKTINTDLAQPTEGTKPAGWEFDATNITINYGQTLSEE